jgi:hypothetical protein
MASVRIGRTDAFSAVERSGEEFVRRGLTPSPCDNRRQAGKSHTKYGGLKKAMSINRPRPDLLQRFGRRRRHQ